MAYWVVFFPLSFLWGPVHNYLSRSGFLFLAPPSVALFNHTIAEDPITGNLDAFVNKLNDKTIRQNNEVITDFLSKENYWILHLSLYTFISIVMLNLATSSRTKLNSFHVSFFPLIYTSNYSYSFCSFQFKCPTSVALYGNFIYLNFEGSWVNRAPTSAYRNKSCRFDHGWSSSTWYEGNCES